MLLAVVDPHAAMFGYLAAARRRGYEPLVVTSDARECRVHEARHNTEIGRPYTTCLGEVIESEVASSAAIVAALEPYRGRVAGLLPGNETCVTETFEAAAALGFDCAAPEDARCQHVKTAMKARLVAHGVPTPPFQPAATFPAAVAAWRAFGGDCMVKMVDYRSSANVYRVTSHAELAHAWDMITMNRLALDVPFPLSKEAIVEAYVGGREVTAEGYESGGRVEILNFTEKVTSDRFIVVDHFVPARLSPAEQAAVEEVARACVRALKVRNSVFHIELHILDGLPYVIECAARPPGSAEVLDAITWTHGADLLDINIALSTGEPVTTRYREPAGHFGILRIYANESGRVDGLTGLVDLREKGGLRRWHLTARLGDHVEALTDFRRQYGSLVIEHDTADGVRALADWVRENVRLIVTPSDPGDSGDSGSAVTAGMSSHP